MIKLFMPQRYMAIQTYAVGSFQRCFVRVANYVIIVPEGITKIQNR